MVRNILGTVLAIIGAAAAISSPYQSWYDGRHGDAYRFGDIFNQVTATESSAYESMLIPMAVAALVTLVGLLLRSRLLVGLAGLLVLGFTVLWMVQQGRAAGQLVITSKGTGLGQGVADALGGGILLLVAAIVMSGRSWRRSATPGAPTQPMRPAQAVYAPSEYQQSTPQQTYEPPTAYEQPSKERYERSPYEQSSSEPSRAEPYDRPGREPERPAAASPQEPTELPPQV